MNIKSSANLAKESGESIYITINGAGDGVFMSLEAYEQMEEKLLMRFRVLTAENARQAGGRTYTQKQLDERFRNRYDN